MPKIPVLTAQKVVKILKKHGFIMKRQTGSIINQAGLTVKNFSK